MTELFCRERAGQNFLVAIRQDHCVDSQKLPPCASFVCSIGIPRVALLWRLVRIDVNAALIRLSLHNHSRFAKKIHALPTRQKDLGT